jgi:regulation of enolase protein 1 (concanavalin A-like superfamily)
MRRLGDAPLTPRPVTGHISRALVKAPWLAAIAVCVMLTLADRASGQTALAGWIQADIGATPSPSVLTQVGDRLSITTSAGGFGDHADRVSFVYRPLANHATAVVKLTSHQAIDSAAAAGLMIRESLLPDARHVSLLAVDGAVVVEQRRQSGGTAASAAGRPVPAVTSPVWLKLQRAGGDIVASRSSDGVTWATIRTLSLELPQTVLVGVVATAGPSGWAAASFSDVALAGEGVLAGGFAAIDIGTPPAAGSSWGAGGTFELGSAGEAIGGANEQFRFVYRRMNGDLDLVARADRVQSDTAQARAGLVLRDSLTVGASHISLLASQHGVELVTLNATSATTTPGGALDGAVWLRLLRRGAVVDALRSPDGIYWAHVGRGELPGGEMFAGVGVASGTPPHAASVRFDNAVFSSSGTGAATRAEGVRTPSAVPTQLAFTPSRLHAQVDRYILEIYADDADSGTASAVAVVSLGRPGITNGECAVDIRAQINALRPGAYFVTITAVIPAEGHFRSDRSPVFTR